MANDDIELEESIDKKDVDVDDLAAKMMIKCFFGMKTMNRQFRIENFFNFLEPFDTHFSKIRIQSTTQTTCFRPIVSDTLFPEPNSRLTKSYRFLAKI